MQSFQKIASLIVLMLLASKEAAALPQPQIPNAMNNNIGTVGNQAGVASGNISPSSVNVGNGPTFPVFFGGPGPRILPGNIGVINRPIPLGSGSQILSGNTEATTIGTAGNQIGVASGNIDPGSLNARDEFDLETRQYYPSYYPGYYYPASSLAVSTIGTAGNQIGVASGNINPMSTNYPRDLEAGQYYPGYYYPSYYYPGGNYAASSIGTVGNQIGVASGNINPSSTNYPRED